MDMPSLVQISKPRQDLMQSLNKFLYSVCRYDGSSMTETVDGHEWLHLFAKWLRTAEKRLAQASRPPVARTQRSVSASVLQSLRLVEDLSAQSLTLDLHHLAYLLLEFERAGLSPGPLDIELDFTTARPLSMYSILSALPPADTQRNEVMSFISGFSWFTQSSATERLTEEQLSKEIKYLYACATKIPSLTLRPQVGKRDLPAPLTRFIHSFETLPDNSYVPLHAFKNLQHLVIDGDPRVVLGWDILSEHLKTLKITSSGLEDINELLVEAVLDHADIAATGKRRSVVPDNPARTLSPGKWRQLRKLGLPANNLTSVPSEHWGNFVNLVSLDLSSNLLVSIPSGLAELVCLQSLNLSDNMIDNILPISSIVGAITTLNLARNRIASLCGLERLKSLNNLDITFNSIIDAAEIGRLAQLPELRNLYATEGNPFVHTAAQTGSIFMSTEAEQRLRLLTFFAREGHMDLQLDGSTATWLEVRSIKSRIAQGAVSSRQLQSSRGQEAARRSVTSPVLSSITSPHLGFPTGDVPEMPSLTISKRKKPVRRIVDLDAVAIPAEYKQHSRANSDMATPQVPIKAVEKKAVTVAHRSANKRPRVLASTFEIPSPQDDVNQ